MHGGVLSYCLVLLSCLKGTQLSNFCSWWCPVILCGAVAHGNNTTLQHLLASALTPPPAPGRLCFRHQRHSGGGRWRVRGSEARGRERQGTGHRGARGETGGGPAGDEATDDRAHERGEALVGWCVRRWEEKEAGQCDANAREGRARARKKRRKTNHGTESLLGCERKSKRRSWSRALGRGDRGDRAHDKSV